jgi:hypothetical protein
MTFDEYSSRIRDLINAPRKQAALLKERNRWLQLCSSLDVIGDTELALEAHAAEAFPKSDGASYLIVYGTLQALFLQQDALFHLAEALTIPETLDKYARLREVREIRNASIGHPTRQGGATAPRFNFITRVTLNKNGFSLLSDMPDGSIKSTPISIPNLMKDQQRDGVTILANIIAALEEEEEMHREQFRGKKLEALLPERHSYYFQKVFEGTHTPAPEVAAVAKAGLHTILDQIEAFRSGLVERGLEDIWHIKDSLKEIAYPLSRLDQYFDDILATRDVSLSPRDAYIYAFFAEQKIEHLRATAKELDELYASKVKKG